MSRISSSQVQQGAIQSMIDQHVKLSRVQQQVSTGKKILKPSEDPVASSRIVNLKDTLSSIEQFQTNVNSARARITLSEGVLSSVVESIHRVRELTIQANNDSQGESARSFIGAEVEQIQDALLNLANTTDSNNEFLYSGSLSRFKPFSHSVSGGFEYNGDESHREVQISRSRRISVDDSGASVFLEIRNGNGTFTTLDSVENKGTGIIDPGRSSGNYSDETYAIIFDDKFSNNANATNTGKIPLSYSVVDSHGTVLDAGIPFQSGSEITFKGVHTSITGEPEDGDYFVVSPSQNQSVFTTLEHLITSLKSPPHGENGKVGYHNAINRSLTNLTQILDNILVVRGNIGARLNALDSQETINETYRVQLKEVLSEAEDLDFAEAVSRLNLEMTGLKASQKAFTRVQDISLFNYL